MSYWDRLYSDGWVLQLWCFGGAEVCGLPGLLNVYQLFPLRIARKLFYAVLGNNNKSQHFSVTFLKLSMAQIFVNDFVPITA